MLHPLAKPIDLRLEARIKLALSNLMIANYCDGLLRIVGACLHRRFRTGTKSYNRDHDSYEGLPGCPTNQCPNFRSTQYSSIAIRVVHRVVETIGVVTGIALAPGAEPVVCAGRSAGTAVERIIIEIGAGSIAVGPIGSHASRRAYPTLAALPPCAQHACTGATAATTVEVVGENVGALMVSDRICAIALTGPALATSAGTELAWVADVSAGPAVTLISFRIYAMLTAHRGMQRVTAGGRLTRATHASLSRCSVASDPAGAAIVGVGVQVYADSVAASRQVGVVATYRLASRPLCQIAGDAGRADVAASAAIVLIMENIYAVAAAVGSSGGWTADARSTL